MVNLNESVNVVAVHTSRSAKQNCHHIHSRYSVKIDQLREKTCLCFQPIYAQTYLLRIIVALNSYCLLRFIAGQTVTLGDGFYFFTLNIPLGT